MKVEWRKEAAICVVVASAGYPTESSPAKEIRGLSQAAALENVYIFHSGTSKKNKKIFAAGGRVLGVTATDPHFPTAYERVYNALSKIKFDGMHYRKDIGRKALEHIKRS
jgi:phosphoribosylamine--glycine ligase